ncbi:MAG: polyprenyl synthetase family protein [Planctomycetota bacterium]
MSAPPAPPPEGDLAAWLEDARRWTAGVLERLVPPAAAHPARLHAAMRYALFGGGKALRPALLRHVCRAAGGADAAAERPAAALEMVHAYSLIHDDLPCMDDDVLRRGRPTCHVAFDEATAVLAGDALLTLAFEVLSEPGQPAAATLVRLLARAAGAAGMVGGQSLDLTLPPAGGDPSAELARLADMHRRKTGALFGAAGAMGAVAAGADARFRAAAQAWAEALGACFQATDDLLDADGDAASRGKAPGTEAALARTNLVLVRGVEGARAEARRLGEAAREQGVALGFGPGDPAHALVDFLLSRRA